MPQNIHFVGIKGTGMSALAQIAKQQPFTVVTGSDVPQRFFTDDILDACEIAVMDFNPANVEHVDLVVVSPAYDANHPEIKRAAELGVEVLSYPQYLGRLMSEKIGICVSGTHGKTTTTAMLGKILIESGFDPTIVVGSEVPALGGNAHVGSGSFFLAESCEYRRHFLNYSPLHLIITNMELDHPDYFRDLNDVLEAFNSLAAKLPPEGNLVIWEEDPSRRSISTQGSITTYGLTDASDVQALNITYDNQGSHFDVMIRGELAGHLDLVVTGRHNILNALAAIALTRNLALPLEIIFASLAGFTGTKRRFERIGTRNGAIIFDDYAHHPTEIQTTLDGVRRSYPERRIRAVFQPHTFSRTQKLLNEFSESFLQADEVVLAEIFSSARETRISDFSSLSLASLIEKKGTLTRYFSTLDEITQYLGQTVSDNDLVITLGAGDIYKVGQDLIC
ncbi:MAG: UDP-N-acetylmuramate--L-alanine ligase [Gracilibacteraceae bacterium]|nr:UDP-N-acetylmuramate--L-alanine ligase [Gracilibacteraceae bacterium]